MLLNLLTFLPLCLLDPGLTLPLLSF